MAPEHHQAEWKDQIGEPTSFSDSDRLLQGITNCSSLLKLHANGLRLGENGTTTLSQQTLGINNGTGFDLPGVVNVVENSPSSVTTSQSLKDVGKSQIAHLSQNACTSSSSKESEAMKRWKAIKQNGFLTHPNGGVPMPEPQHRKRSKRKIKGTESKTESAKVEQHNMNMERTEVERNYRKLESAKGGQDNRKMRMAQGESEQKKIETEKREQTQQSNMLKSAPSSGLLSRISTGIVRRVKNYEEVHAVLEGLVRLEKPAHQIQNEIIDLEGSKSDKISCSTKLSESTLSI